jgi:hypothetical protein
MSPSDVRSFTFSPTTEPTSSYPECKKRECRLPARGSPTHQRGPEPGDALAHGLAAIDGCNLGMAGGAGGHSRMHKAKSQAEQDAGKHDIDDAHCFLRNGVATFTALLTAAILARFGSAGCSARNSGALRHQYPEPRDQR